MLITDQYRELNKQLHRDNEEYGTSGHKYADAIASIYRIWGCTSALDYGSGKGTLKRSLPQLGFAEYDPAIPGKDAMPVPADLVVCNDVLEHIEPECLDAVLEDLARVTGKIGFFVADLFPAKKFLADGRNAHLLLETEDWWKHQVSTHLEIISSVSENLQKVVMLVRPYD